MRRHETAKKRQIQRQRKWENTSKGYSWDTDYSFDWEPDIMTIKSDTGQHSQFLRCLCRLFLLRFYIVWPNKFFSKTSWCITLIYLSHCLTEGAWATAIWWHWGNFLALWQRLHILHVAGIWVFHLSLFSLQNGLPKDYFFSKLFPASIPHLLSHHTTGKRAASEHRSVQPKQGFYLMIILEDTLKKLSFRKLLLTSMFSSTHTSSVRTSEDVR